MKTKEDVKGISLCRGCDVVIAINDEIKDGVCVECEVCSDCECIKKHKDVIE